MAEIIKISELPSQTVFADDDLLVSADTSEIETKKLTFANMKEYSVGDTTTLTTTSKEVVGAINENDTRLTTAEAVIGNETDTYSASSTYALGSLVIYNSLLYKCTTAITVSEAWNSAKWTQVNLTSISSDINGKILWTNPNPLNTFNAQDIALNSSDYDMYKVLYCTNIGNAEYLSVDSIKGKGVWMDWFYTDTSGSPIYNMFHRDALSTDATHLHFNDAKVNGTLENNWCIPICIIGYKTGLFS